MFITKLIKMVETTKVLNKLKLEFEEHGAYYYFKCIKCQNRATIKATATGRILGTALAAKRPEHYFNC